MSYAPPASTPAAAGPDFIAKGDLNGDADIDLVSVNTTGDSVTVLLGNGAGGFSSVTNYPVGNAPRWVAIGDLDGVNGNDLAVTNTEPGGAAGSITVLLNDGSGGFTEASGSPIDIETLAGAGAQPFSLVIAQLNSGTDSNLDIAVSNDITDNVQILLGAGDGTFTTGATIAVGTKPISIAAGSVDTATDALTDLVVGNYTSNTVSVLLGDGTGGFTDASGSPFATTSFRPFNVTIASIDSLADPIPDIALVNYFNAVQTVEVFRGVGDGTFTSTFISSKLAGRPHSVEVADLDGDSDVDLAIASDNSGADSPAAAVTVLLGDGSGAFPTVAQYPLSGSPKGVVSANLDNANQVDLAVANGSGNVDVLLSVLTLNAPVASDGFLQVPSTDVGSANPQNGTLVGTDADGALLRYTIASSATNGTVAITNAATGAYTYTPNTVIVVPDSFTFTVDDGTGPSAVGTIQVVQNDSAPVIDSDGGGDTAAVGADENQTAVVTTVTATDADSPAQTLTYSISGGADAAKFSINSSSGVLTFSSAPNFEIPTDAGANNVYDVWVQVADGNGGVDVQDIAVTVADVNEAPIITSNGGGATAAVSANENQTAVTTVTATDVDAGQTLTYSISGGADAASFSIDSGTGVLTFAAAPNFETPTDTGADNIYDVQVTVTDDGAGTLTDVQDIAVTVTPDSNSDGISDAQAAAIGLDPQLTDTDGDGASDAAEVGGDPANPVDTDSDGIIDALEFAPADPNTLEFVVPAPTATTLSLPDLSGQQVTLSGNGAAVTANNNGATGLPLYAESDLAVADASFEYPFGVYDFSVVAIGGTATVTLTLPAGAVIPANAVVRKLGVGNQWQTLDTAVIDRNNNSITLTLADNDGVFDLDNTAGVIRDPVGVAVPVTVASSGGGGGGGGCSLSAVPRQAGFDPLLPLLTLVPLLYLRRKRKQNVA